ncbi:MAG: DUF423 domain-containing protein, partial [Acidobacteriota bacterium]
MSGVCAPAPTRPTPASISTTGSILILSNPPTEIVTPRGFYGTMVAIMDTRFLLVAAVAGFLGVAAGAFGAHGLRGRLSPDMLGVFETAVRYQMYHVFALL